jgi:hypothetical protein
MIFREVIPVLTLTSIAPLTNACIKLLKIEEDYLEIDCKLGHKQTKRYLRLNNYKNVKKR